MKWFHNISDWAARSFGSEWFFIFHIAWWGFWLTDRVEPFPYGLLTLIVSLESILLSGLILNATNRSSNEDRRIINKDLRLDRETNQQVEEVLEGVKKILERLDDKTKPN